MSHSFIIEVGEDAVGIILRQSPQDHFRFIASDSRVGALEGRTFQQPRDAERAARDIIRRRKTVALWPGAAPRPAVALSQASLR